MVLIMRCNLCHLCMEWWCYCFLDWPQCLSDTCAFGAIFLTVNGFLSILFCSEETGHQYISHCKDCNSADKFHIPKWIFDHLMLNGTKYWPMMNFPFWVVYSHGEPYGSDTINVFQ